LHPDKNRTIATRTNEFDGDFMLHLVLRRLDENS